jgi:hypothetical protein
MDLGKKGNRAMTKKLVFVSVICLWLMVSLSCSLTGERAANPEPSAEGDSLAAVATSVAATLAAGEEQERQPSIPEPTATGEPLQPMAPTANLLGISFYFNPQLAESLSSKVVPANEGEAPWWAAPEYRQISFQGWIPAEGILEPTIRVFSTEEFSQINPNIGERLAALQASLEANGMERTGLAVPEIFNAGQFFQSNVRTLDFQNGSGARWLSQYGQAYFPIGFPRLFYTFQGFTEDGAYYLSVILPVAHTILPPADSVALDDAFFNNYESYSAENASLLEAQPDASFTPSLELLDQMVESIMVAPE